MLYYHHKISVISIILYYQVYTYFKVLLLLLLLSLLLLLGQVRFILTSVVGTNSDPSDEIHLWIINSFSFCLPRLPQVPLVARPVK
jgi:hypothetical protein